MCKCLYTYYSSINCQSNVASTGVITGVFYLSLVFHF